MKAWFEARGYREIIKGEAEDFFSMPAGTFSLRLNVPVTLDGGKQVNIPVDAVIMRHNAKSGDFPALFEAKSAGDFTNTNKRRKEEAIKIQQLRKTYEDLVQTILNSSENGHNICQRSVTMVIQMAHRR